MTFEELITNRYSVRAYRRDAVSDEDLERVLQAAILAPTAANRQPFRLLVLRGRGEELRRIFNRDWFVQAPIVICICGVQEEAWVRKCDGANYMLVDVAIAMDHLILAATALGLGTCWVAAFDVAVARDVLGLPQGVEPIAFTPLGYAADEPSRKRRKSLEELLL